jgi:sugar (pentulose or hexulose) kinase
MRALAAEDVGLDAMFAHGGLFRTKGVAQRLLAAAIDAPVAVGRSAGEGGAWGVAVLARYRAALSGQDLATYLREQVFAGARFEVVEPDADEVAAFAAHLQRYAAALPVERAATQFVS